MAKSAYPRLHRAIKFAVKAHKKQDRDGEHPLPYVTHAFEVLNLCRYEGETYDEDVLCAALLHDVIEETGRDEDDIEAKFGERTAQLVKELTRQEPDEETMQLPEEELWKIRNAMMMGEIDRMSSEAKLIKLADRCANLRDAKRTKTGNKLTRYVEQSQGILQHIDRAICPPLWDRLDRMVQEMTQQNGASGLKKKKPDVSQTPTIAG